MSKINKYSDHAIEDEKHEDTNEILDELMEHTEKEGYPEHIIELLKGIKGELEEYEDDKEEEPEEDKEEEKPEEDIEDNDDIKDFAKDELEKEGHPIFALKIGIKPKKK